MATTTACRRQRSATMPPARTPSEAPSKNTVNMPFATAIETPKAAGTAEGRKVCNPVWAIDNRVK